ncbi:PAS domain S-box protein [Salinirubellus salinus]
MVKNGPPLAPGTIAALDPLNQKLADACCNRRVEQEAAQTRETLRTVLDTIPQEVSVKDSDGRYTLANESAAAAHGVRIEELEGATDEEYARASADRDVRATDMEVIESGEPRRIEDEEIVDADGRTRTITTDIVPLELSGAERRALVVATDTTERTEREAELRRTQAELRAERARLQTLFDSAPEGVTIHDAEGTILEVNQTEADALGYDRETLIGMNVAEIAVGITKEELTQIFADMEVGETVEAIATHRRADGTTFPVEVWVAKVGVEGRDPQFVALDRDITERQEKQRRLERQRERLRILFDESPDSIVVHDADGNVLDVNQAQLDTLGYDRETLLGMNVAEFEVGHTLDELREMWASIEVGGMFKTEGEHRRADGTTYPIEVWVSKTEIDGEVRFIALDRDISERIERETRLKRTNTVLQTVLDSLPAGVLVEDPNRDILTVNRRLLELFGMETPTDALVGLDCEAAAEDLKHTFAEPEQFLSRIDHLIEARTPVTKEPLTLADGRKLERDYVPYELPDGEASLWMYRDITEQAQREADLRETRRQLRQSNEELEQFAYAASHDLKEPLRSVSNYLTLLDDLYDEGQTFDAQAETLIQNAVGATGRMQSMINALLQYSRVDSRGGDLEPTALDAVVEKAELNLTVRIDDVGATVTTEPLPTVSGDERLLIQLFQNLIDNGLKYNESANPRIGITPGEPVTSIDPPEPVALDGGTSWHHIRVEDNGIGMDADVADRAFDVFERLGQTGQNGTGMGLTLCQRIVEYHNGAIWIESAPGDGTVVHVCLPAASA